MVEKLVAYARLFDPAPDGWVHSFTLTVPDVPRRAGHSYRSAANLPSETTTITTSAGERSGTTSYTLTSSKPIKVPIGFPVLLTVYESVA